MRKAEAAGIEIIPLDRILGSIRYIPLNTGEGWGYLRIFPGSNDALDETATRLASSRLPESPLRGA